jgi:hypothetical protein
MAPRKRARNGRALPGTLKPRPRPSDMAAAPVRTGTEIRKCVTRKDDIKRKNNNFVHQYKADVITIT